MNRKQKIELLKEIAEGNKSIYDLNGYVLVVQKDSKNYLTDGVIIGQEISDSELNLITCPKIYLDEQFLGL